MRAPVWLAMASIVSGAGRLWVRPTPALSKMTTRWCWAKVSTKTVSQSSIVALQPAIITSAGP